MVSRSRESRIGSSTSIASKWIVDSGEDKELCALFKSFFSVFVQEAVLVPHRILSAQLVCMFVGEGH